MRQRSILAVALLAASLPSGAVSSAQRTTVDDETGMSCVERLEMPTYHPLAQAARIRGAMRVIARLAQGGSVQSVEFEDSPAPFEARNAKEFFHPEAERALRASRFASSCGGRTVTVVFEFRLVGYVEDNYRGVAFQYPNHFEIIASEPAVNP